MSNADFIITGDDDQMTANEIQQHAERHGWGDVRPETQQRVRFRSTMINAVVQRRGAFFFASAIDSDGVSHTIGPHPRKAEAARMAVEAAKHREAA